MIYLFIFLLLLWFTYFYDYKGEKRGWWLSFYVILILFILVAGLRYRIGGDTVSYLKYYDKLHPLNALGGGDFTNSRFAPGYLFLTSLFKTFTPDFTYFQVFHALVVNSVVFFFIKKNCRHFFFGVLLYFIYLYVFLSFEQMRESFAVAIFLLAWPAFKKGIWWKWYLAAICAFMFHVSAFFMFILPVICCPGIRELFKFGNRTFYICMGIFILAFVLQTTFFRYIQILSFTESMQDRIEAYGEIKRSEILNINRVIGVSIQYILYPILAIYTLYKMNQKNTDILKKDNGYNKEFMMALMSIYISIFTIFIGIFIRYNNYFFMFAIILMGNWIFTKIYLFKRFMRLGYLYWILLFAPMIGVTFYYIYLTPINKGETLYNYMRYYPYSSVLDQNIDPDREKTITYIRKKI